MARKKVEYKVTLTRHGIFEGDTDEEITREAQKQADYMFYQNSDSCEVEIVNCVDFE